MIEHDVNDDTGNRNIEPKRKRPAGDLAVPDEVSSCSPVRGNQNERDDYDSQHHMSNQNREIERPHNSLPQKARVAVVVMISKIRNYKEGGRSQGGKLALSMRLNPSIPDVVIARPQEELRWWCSERH